MYRKIYIYLMCKAWGSYRHRTFEAQKRAFLGHLKDFQLFPFRAHGRILLPSLLRQW